MLVKCVCGTVQERRSRGYCTPCHAAYQRKHRPKYSDLSEAAKAKARVRAKSRYLVASGKIAKMPCRDCGSANAERHHPDYSDPWNIEWLCRTCHVEHHMAEAA